MPESQRDGSAAKTIDPRYLDGRYHRQVFSGDPFVQHVLATRRARKLQPLINSNDTVFEFGSGTALNLRYLKCARRAGFDPNPQAGDSCRAHGIEFFKDLSELGSQTFDVVLAHHVLEHVENPLQTLQSLTPLLAPRGRLLVFVPFERSKKYLSNEPNMHLFSWTPQTLGNLAVRAGLDVQSVSVSNYGYEQRLAPIAKFGWPLYTLALRLAWLVRPCEEVRLIATQRNPALNFQRSI
jgi:SAM-dependent methyltransferase